MENQDKQRDRDTSAKLKDNTAPVITAAKAARRGGLLVVSSPSGAGKTTLCRRLLAAHGEISFSVSVTTRPRRGSEVEGVDYQFVTDAVFSEMVAKQSFSECAVVHDCRYGTPREPIESAISEGRDLLFDVDWQGGEALKELYPSDTVMVFVVPPSMESLAQRLRARQTDAADVITRRLGHARGELVHYENYDYVIVNDDLEAAYAELDAIYRASQCRRTRRVSMIIPLLT